MEPQVPSAYGAIDLSSLQTAAPEEGQEVAAGEIIIEITAQSLPEQLELSKQVPVMLVVCAQQIPESVELVKLLSEKAKQLKGALRIGILDAQSQPQLVQMIGVSAIPFVLALVGGQAMPVADQNLTAEQVNMVCDQLLTAAARAGVTGKLALNEALRPTEAALPKFEQEAQAAITIGDFSQAIKIYQDRLRQAPADQLASVGLKRCTWQQRLAQLDLATTVTQANLHINDLDWQLQAADVELGIGLEAEAFSRLLTYFDQADSDSREILRCRLLEYFEIVGASPEVNAARRALATKIF